MRTLYIKDLENLKEDLILFSLKVENLIRKSKELFGNEKLEKKYFETKNLEIYQYEKMIENKCINLLSTQQPVARDLRFISATIKISNHIRRMGEHSIEILELFSQINFENFKHYDIEQNLHAMREEVLEMFKDSINLFLEFDNRFYNNLLEKDTTKAYTIIDRDDYVDDIYDNHIENIVKIMKETTGFEKSLIFLLHSGKYFERIGDNVEQIVKNILFVIKGDYDE